MTLLEVKDLHTCFDTQHGLCRAVNGVSFSVKRGETLGIVGESGCGKSVTALSIIRLLPRRGKISNGQILFEQRDLVQLPEVELFKIRGKQIAMIFQSPMTSLNPVMTIGRQIGESLELHLNMTAEQARKRTAELLSMVGIPAPETRLNAYPHQFSGGMRQRVMIAMALACDPQLLIADEPTTALDVTVQAQIVKLVKQLRDELGMAIIWITHDLGLMARLADRLVVMYAGSVIETAPVVELYENPRHPYTIGLLGSLPRLDERENRRLKSIEGRPPDLTAVPQGCPFAPRCTYVIERCRDEKPDLLHVGVDHQAACWVDVRTHSLSSATGDH